ncbi:lipopolysaccharide biosynthesis protein [Micromonospora costi]|uniref:lipopolysaccharide biosynthesis protein n=1 Tax=Micromonospora costi TaxID=1530042 RepID=UPI00131A0635|nr:lipopolysaccharide biosynthesis protein [Micromonospora costi]
MPTTEGQGRALTASQEGTVATSQPAGTRDTTGPAGETAADGAGSNSLSRKAGRALGWSFGSNILGRLSTLAIGIAIARLLGPDDFGVFAVAAVALTAVLSFNELGVSLAIVRWPGDPREIAPTVMTISLVSSAVIYAGCFFGAPAFAAAMGEPGATGVVRLLTVSVLVDALVATPVAMLQRQFKQGRKTIADQTTHWLGSLTSIGLAVWGMGAMSLAVGRLAGAVAGAVLFICFEPRAVRLGFDPAKARALLRFGLPLAGSSIVTFAVQNVDKIIVGAVLGPVALGYYVLASNLSAWPISSFSQPVRSVAPAAFSRLQDRPGLLRETFTAAAGLLAAVSLPACVLLAAAAEPLIRFVYGAQWTATSTILPWLGLLAALRILFELVYDYFVVLANSRAVLTVQVVWFVVLVPVLALACQRFGLVGAGASQLAVALLVVAPLYVFELHRSGITPRALVARLWSPVAAAVAVAALVLLATRAVAVDLLALAVAGLVGLAGMAAVTWTKRRTLAELRTVAVD